MQYWDEKGSGTTIKLVPEPRQYFRQPHVSWKGQRMAESQANARKGKKLDMQSEILKRKRQRELRDKYIKEKLNAGGNVIFVQGADVSIDEETYVNASLAK